ncbi:MAG: cobalamin B12-binding domain-containing protein [Nitrososphaerales archaeon]
MEEFERLVDAIVKGDVEGGKAISEIIGNKKLPIDTAILEGILKGVMTTMDLMASGKIEMMKMADCVKTAYAALEILDKFIVVPKVVIGCVKGEAHAMAKDIIATLFKASGFEVYNLGNRVSPETFVEKVKETGADILAMSACMDITMPAMKETIEALKAAGIRESVKVLVGGRIVTGNFAKEIGADAYGKDPAEGLEHAKKLLAK